MIWFGLILPLAFSCCLVLILVLLLAAVGFYLHLLLEVLLVFVALVRSRDFFGLVYSVCLFSWASLLIEPSIGTVPLLVGQ